MMNDRPFPSRDWIARPRPAIVTICSLLLRVVSFAQSPSSTNLIRIQISGLHSDKGQAVCALFASAKDFPKNPQNAIARTQSAIAHGRAVCEFAAVGPGRYAVSVFHDENANGKLDTNFMGIPREGVGASNNAIGHFGPPKFEAAAFDYSGGTLELAITITYL